ncbi:MAG: OmpA family protein [Brevinematales bacterium]
MKQFITFIASGYMLIILGSCSTIKPEEFNKLKSDNTSLTAENQALKTDKANLAAENQSLMNDQNQKKKDLDTLQDARDKMQNLLYIYSNDNVSLKNLSDSTKNSLGKQVENLETSIKDRDLKIASLQDEITNRDSQISDLQKTINSLSESQAKLLQEKNLEISNITATHNKMESAMQAELASGELKIKQIGDILSVDFQDKIFFDSGSADIRNSGKMTLDKVARVLKTITNKQVRIEGYTDNDPIAPGYQWKFPSNWELSTARATTIVRYLQSQGIDPSLLKATGYGEYNPIAPNDTAEGKAQNRRIVILLVPLDERARYK